MSKVRRIWKKPEGRVYNLETRTKGKLRKDLFKLLIAAIKSQLLFMETRLSAVYDAFAATIIYLITQQVISSG